MAGKMYAEPQDFADETIFLYPPKSDSTLLNEFLTPAGIVPRRIQEVMLTEAIIEMVRGGLGVATSGAVGGGAAAGVGCGRRAPTDGKRV